MEDNSIEDSSRVRVRGRYREESIPTEIVERPPQLGAQLHTIPGIPYSEIGLYDVPTILGGFSIASDTAQYPSSEG
ncbi:hypothetical protein NPIL_13701 [Nephila pilipes]|uniref:Uncharacterized protein n=1 Tax=Nephila pilipes TaxID=299642 RepID=A0A8X6TFW3_NEPPI|nr:hypothetical protein NPIL_13701 [Nephila pilipes]